MTLTIDQRRDALQREINGYLRRGFRVVSQTDTSAQLTKPKSFSFLWAIIWFLALGVGLIVYILYYMAKKDENVYLTIDETGRIQKR